MALVYRATNRINGHCYVGMTSKSLQRRQYGHFLDARRGAIHMPFVRAIKKYGKEAFSWEVLGEFPTVAEAVEAEIRWIATLSPHYNVTRGGPGITGIKRSLEWRAAMSARFKGRTLSPEGLRKMIEMSRAGRGCKPVICLNDGRCFASINLAGGYYGVHPSQVSNSANGNELSANGFYFAYGGGDVSADERERLIADRKGRKARLSRAAHAKRSPGDFLQRCGIDVSVEPIAPLPLVPKPAYQECSAEAWRPVIGYEGSYEVSDHGRVRSCDRLVACWANNGKMLRHGKLMNMRPMKHGRLFVTLCRDGRYQTLAVAVMVAQAFIGEAPFDDPRVMRRDSAVTNDLASNLYWGTAKDVAAERRRRGSATVGMAHWNAKLSADEITLIRQSRGKIKQTELAHKLGVCAGAVSKIQLGKSRRHCSSGPKDAGEGSYS